MSGHAAAAPPMRVMMSRRLMRRNPELMPKLDDTPTLEQELPEQRASRSLDQPVGKDEHIERNLQPNRLGGIEIDHQLEFHRRLHRQIAGLLALEDTVDIGRSLPIKVDKIGAVGDQASAFGIDVVRVDCRQAMANRK